MTLLSDGDRFHLPAALRANQGFHLACGWYLRDWIPMPWQWAWHQLIISNTTIIAGIASGKTAVASASNAIDCISIPYFRALNTSVTAKQAELAFDMAMGWIEGNPRMEHLVDNISLRPFPQITFKNFSEWDFRTAGTDARFIRGSEYDRINFDEAGLDVQGAIVKVLRGRLRGKRPDGTQRMARLDVISSPTASLWLKERFNKGWPGDPTFDKRLYRSIRATTYMNVHLTEEQVAAMEAEYPTDMIDVEMGGEFPDFGMSMFPLGHIEACMYQEMYDSAYMALNPENGKPIPGYVLEEDPRHGVIKYEVPVTPGHIYVACGDPGTDNYPKRNSPCVMVADVTTEPIKLVYFHWGAGKGSIIPFMSSYKYAIEKYSPVLNGIDATGTQKYMDEIGFENFGISTSRLSFNADKAGMLNNLSMDITSHKWLYPPIQGLYRQLSTYIPEEDTPSKKLAQDLVMAMAGISYLRRAIPPEAVASVEAIRANHRNRHNRANVRQSR